MMRSLYALPMALALVRAVPVQSDNELKLVWQQDKTTDESSIRLTSVEGDKTFASGCGTELNVHGTNITMNVNGHGVGTLGVGDKTYRVVGDRERSGGISCTKMYNNREDIIKCTIPWSESASDLEIVDESNVESCFSEHSHVRRQGGGLCNGKSPPTTELLDGDGNPEQDVLHRQVGHEQTCAQKGNCFVGVGEEVSVTIEASVSGGFDWFSGGFSVSKTRSESTERGCYGEAGDTVCQWVSVDHTRYQARRTTWEGCAAVRKERDFEIVSPNEGEQAVNWYCVVNTCRNKDDQYWENEQ